jgi:4-alpha-glucanotransferase
MDDQVLLARAHQSGIAVDWVDSMGTPRRVSSRSLRLILDALDAPTPASDVLTTSFLSGGVGRRIPLPDVDQDRSAMLELEDGTRHSLRLSAGGGLPPLPPGYHTLRHGEREVTLAVAPERCLTVADLAPGQLLWGLIAQVYSLRRTGDGGIGDTTAVATLAEAAVRQGADAVALSPMHSLFPSDLSRYSPYSPSSRLFLNPLLIDPMPVLGTERVMRVLGNVAAPPSGPLIDWPTASARKYALLRRLYDDFVHRDLASDDALAHSFHTYVKREGSALEAHAGLEAERSGNGTTVEYHKFLQWLADAALAGVQRRARQSGMRIGLITDLAVGLDAGGTEVSARPGDYLRDLSIGAPPDMFNADGQDWGLTSFSPSGLRAGGFAPFIATVRAALRHAGGVRIDHAMGLMRLWVMPRGATPSEGAYLSYPLDDLLRLLALESHRHGAIIIGEDLGTVPPGFRKRCHEAGIAGMDVLWFERSDEAFRPPSRWRPGAVAMTSTHDLPTVAGWWQGSDLERRGALGKAGPQEWKVRSSERASLWRAFVDAGVAQHPAPEPDCPQPAVDAALAFVAHACDPLVLAPLEDVAGTVDQPNLPGTIDEHPNWRRRFDLATDQLLQSADVRRRLALLNRRRT